LQTDTDRIWKFQRYQLVCEYLSRPSLPPPLILFSHVYRFILYLLSKCFTCEGIQHAYRRHSSRTKYSKKKKKKNVEHFVGEKTIFSLEINLDEKKAILIEISEDAFGDEVYYNYLKLNRKLIDETDLDEERV